MAKPLARRVDDLHEVVPPHVQGQARKQEMVGLPALGLEVAVHHERADVLAAKIRGDDVRELEGDEHDVRQHSKTKNQASWRRSFGCGFRFAYREREQEEERADREHCGGKPDPVAIAVHRAPSRHERDREEEGEQHEEGSARGVGEDRGSSLDPGVQTGRSRDRQEEDPEREEHQREVERGRRGAERHRPVKEDDQDDPCASSARDQ